MIRTSLLLPGTIAILCLAAGYGRAQSAYQQAVDMAGGAPDPSSIPTPRMEREEREDRRWERSEAWEAHAESQTPPRRERAAPVYRPPPPPPPPSREEIALAEAKKTLQETAGRREEAKKALEAERRNLASEKARLERLSAQAGELRREMDEAARLLREAKRGCEMTLEEADAVYFDESELYRPLLGRIVDARIHRRAQREIERLKALSRELDARIERLRSWREDNAKDLAEFESLRAGAVWDAASKILDVLSVSEVIAEHRKVRPEEIARLKAALAALSSAAASAESFSAPSAKERRSKILDAADSAIEALREAGKLPLTEKGKKTFERAQNAIASARRLGEYISDRLEGKASRKEEPFYETAEGFLECALDVAGNWWTPAKVISGAYGLLNAGATYWFTADTVRGLKAARAANFSAERHLLEKKREIEEKIRELELTAVEPYRQAQKLGAER